MRGKLPAVVFNSCLLSQHECHRFPPHLHPVLLLGLGRRQGAVGSLASEGLPVQCCWHSAMEKLLLRGHGDADGAYMALSPGVDAHRVLLQDDGGSGVKSRDVPWDRAGGPDLRYKEETGETNQRSWEVFLYRLSIHFSGTAVR